MNSRLCLSLALLCSCGPLPTDVPAPVEGPLVEADGGSPPPADAGVVVSPADAGLATADAGGVDAGAPAAGLPCDVKRVLEAHCTSCHAGQSYAPHLTTREDFLRVATAAGDSVGKIAAQRMMPGAAAPMPPSTAPSHPLAAEILIVNDWVAAGMPGGECGVAEGH